MAKPIITVGQRSYSVNYRFNMDEDVCYDLDLLTAPDFDLSEWDKGLTSSHIRVDVNQDTGKVTEIYNAIFGDFHVSEEITALDEFTPEILEEFASKLAQVHADVEDQTAEFEEDEYCL